MGGPVGPSVSLAPAPTGGTQVCGGREGLQQPTDSGFSNIHPPSEVVG